MKELSKRLSAGGKTRGRRRQRPSLRSVRWVILVVIFLVAGAAVLFNYKPCYLVSLKNIFGREWGGIVVDSAGGADRVSTAPGAPKVGVAGFDFTLNGRSAFLLGISYFDGRNWRAEDLDFLAARGFNLVRVWLDWQWEGKNASFFDRAGNLTHRDRLLDLVRAAGARGIIVDVTILNCHAQDEGIYPAGGCALNAVRNAVAAIGSEPNVFFDVLNEHPSCLSHSQVASLVQAGRRTNPAAIIFSSPFTFGDHVLGANDTAIIASDIEEELDAGMDVLALHFLRTHDWASRTGERVSLIRRHLSSIGRPVPIYVQEDHRRGWEGQGPSREEFLEAARLARQAGAAGWVLHTAAGFDLSREGLEPRLDAVEKRVVEELAGTVLGAPSSPSPGL